MTTVENTVKSYKLYMEKIPEDPSQLEDVFKSIQLRNSSTVTGNSAHPWPLLVVPQLCKCVLCDNILSVPQRVPGTNGKSYLLTRVGLLPITPYIKRCERQTCLARYCYSNWGEGMNSIVISTYTYTLVYKMHRDF